MMRGDSQVCASTAPASDHPSPDTSDVPVPTTTSTPSGVSGSRPPDGRDRLP